MRSRSRAPARDAAGAATSETPALEAARTVCRSRNTLSVSGCASCPSATPDIGDAPADMATRSLEGTFGLAAVRACARDQPAPLRRPTAAMSHSVLVEVVGGRGLKAPGMFASDMDAYVKVYLVSRTFKTPVSTTRGGNISESLIAP